jgi:hypothetical protein
MRASKSTYCELTNHPIIIGMGNVRAIVSDCKDPETATRYTTQNYCHFIR